MVPSSLLTIVKLLPHEVIVTWHSLLHSYNISAKVSVDIVVVIYAVCWKFRKCVMLMGKR